MGYIHGWNLEILRAKFFLISLYVSHSKMTIKIFRRSTKNTLERKSKMAAISHFHVIHEILKTFKMQKLPMYWVQTHTMCSVHVSPDSVQFSCNSDSICTNYHHSYAETHLIFLNEMCNLAYKVGYKCFKSRHIHYKLSPIVHSISILNI